MFRRNGQKVSHSGNCGAWLVRPPEYWISSAKSNPGLWIGMEKSLVGCNFENDDRLGNKSLEKDGEEKKYIMRAMILRSSL